MSHKEIELKVKLSHDSFVALKKLLTKIAPTKELVAQEDFYLDNTAHSFFTPHDTREKQISLRVRSATHQDSLCLKVAHKGNNENDFYRDEYEIKIDSPQKMLQLFTHLGYTVVKTLKKERTVFIFADYEITLDEISGIAPETTYMVEIESIKPVQDHEAAINKMESFLTETLHVTEYEKFMHGIEKYVNKR